MAKPQTGSWVTLREYREPARAELDRSRLEAAGVQVFIADEESVSSGYGSVLGIRLQVPREEVDEAEKVLTERPEASLPDDFDPPPAEPETAPEAETGRPARWGFRAMLLGGIAGVVVYLLLKGEPFTEPPPGTPVTLAGLLLALIAGGALGLLIRGIVRRDRG